MPIRTDTLLSLQAKKWLKKSPGAWLRSSRQEIVPSLPTNILLRPVLAQGSVCKCVEMLDRRRPGCSTRGPWIHHGARTQRDRAERWNSSSRRWCTTCASRKAPHGVPAMTRRQGRVRDIDRNSSHASCARGGLRLPSQISGPEDEDGTCSIACTKWPVEWTKTNKKQLCEQSLSIAACQERCWNEWKLG